MSRNDDYTTWSLLVFSYNQNYYKLSGIDLSRQSIPQQIIFLEKLQGVEGATKFFTVENQHKN